MLKINKLILIIFVVFSISHIAYSSALMADSVYSFLGYQLQVCGGFGEPGKIMLYKNGALMDTKEYEIEVANIEVTSFEKNGTTKIVATLYSGGAHCCYSISVLNIVSDKLFEIAKMEIGNISFRIKDLDNDGIKELVTYDDRFAYAFSCFADSRFMLAIYHLQNGSFVKDNVRFMDFVLKDIEDLKSELVPIITSKIDCRNKQDGSLEKMKSLLAAIAGSYYMIGEVNKGFSIIDNFYKCSDKEEFIKAIKSSLVYVAPSDQNAVAK